MSNPKHSESVLDVTVEIRSKNPNAPFRTVLDTTRTNGAARVKFGTALAFVLEAYQVRYGSDLLRDLLNSKV